VTYCHNCCCHCFLYLQCAHQQSPATVTAAWQLDTCGMTFWLLHSYQYLQQLRIERAVACLLPHCRRISCSLAKQAAQLQVAAVTQPVLQSAATASCSWISTIAGRPAFPWQLQHHHGGRPVAAIAAVNGSSTRGPQDGSSSSRNVWDAGSGSGSVRGRVEAWIEEVASAAGTGALTATAPVVLVLRGGIYSGGRGWGSSRGGSTASQGSGRPANNRNFATSSGSSGKVRLSANAHTVDIVALHTHLCPGLGVRCGSHYRLPHCVYCSHVSCHAYDDWQCAYIICSCLAVCLLCCFWFRLHLQALDPRQILPSYGTAAQQSSLWH
jgi:hypothetical protein